MVALYGGDGLTVVTGDNEHDADGHSARAALENIPQLAAALCLAGGVGDCAEQSADAAENRAELGEIFLAQRGGRLLQRFCGQLRSGKR